MLGLLRLASRDASLLVIVDDAHWLDAASAECIGFAARRLDDAAVAMLVAIRDGEEEPAGLGALPCVALEPLEGRLAADVVDAAAAGLAAPVRAAIVAAAAGNPLALVEIAASLAPAERSGLAPLPDPLPAGGRLAAVFDRRLKALTLPTREALLVAAACDSGEISLLTRACEAAGVDASHFDEAEAAGIVAIEHGRLHFSHPMLRSAAWHGAGAPSRRAAHRALATVVDGHRRAWHLAESVTGPDVAAADALAEAAAHAAARRGYAESSRAWQRSAALTADTEQKARRLLRACNTSVAAGQMHGALALLEQASAVGSSVTLSPRTLHTRCLLLLGTGEVESAFGFLRFLAEAAAGTTDAAMAAMATADAGMAALLVGEMREVLALGRRATELLGEGGDAMVKAQVGACLAAGLVFCGETEQGRRELEEVERHVLGVLDQELALRTHSMITHLRTALDDYEVAHAHAGGVLEALEAISAHAARAAPLGHAADAAHRLGQWDLADAYAREAVLVAEETANGDVLPRTLVVRARIAAARGDEPTARALLARATALTQGRGNLTIQCYVLVATGLLELSMGRAAEAIVHLEQAGSLIDGQVGLVHPTILPWRPDLVEAYAMVGRADDAANAALHLDEEARRNGGAAGLALAARAQGLVEPDDFEPWFARSLELEKQRPMPFERAHAVALRPPAAPRAATRGGTRLLARGRGHLRIARRAAVA